MHTQILVECKLIQFSEEAKWNKHTGNVIKRVSKYICVLHKLKYKLNKHNLEKLYLIYIRPIFEYACEVWDNCGVCNSCKLERLQLEAARIITGLPIFTNTEYLYRETGWERLEERRTRRKLQLLYNIQNGSTPSYLLDLIPPTIQSTTIYPLRNGNDIIVPLCRLSLTRDSFVSATVREWNNPNLSVRNLDTLSKFKKAIRSLISRPIPSCIFITINKEMVIIFTWCATVTGSI
jgi:hypothetical protein